MTQREPTLVVAGLLAVLLGAPAVAVGATSHVSVFETRTVICGVTAPDLSRTDVLCQANGVPRPPHGSTVEGDPAVSIAASGRPQLTLISQDSYPARAKIMALATGAVWSARGVTCTIASATVTCTNRAEHGFSIGNGRYRHF